MRLCILAPNEHIEEVRNVAESVLPNLKGLILNVPVSPTGELPPTHWFCNFKASQEMFDKLLSLKNFTEMEQSDNTKGFLKERDLKVIKK